ncbi:MAG: hypothetical protein OEY86_06835 [Nitrospira sp.]|nr:hypothetical protein [Nitrospira sp.]
MKKLRHMLSDLEESCQTVYEDDGVDPRRYFRREGLHESSNQCRRFCGYVAKTLNAALAGCTSPVLARLFVVKVVPAPMLSRLEVVVDATGVESCVSGEAIREELARATQILRSEIGRVIARKYVPELCFRLASPEEVLR